MTDRERYIDIYTLKVKLRQWCSSWGVSKNAKDGLYAVIKKIPYTVHASLSETLDVPSAGGWTPVRQALPGSNRDVLVQYVSCQMATGRPCMRYAVAFYSASADGWFDPVTGRTYNVVAWCDFDRPPGEEDNDDLTD